MDAVDDATLTAPAPPPRFSRSLVQRSNGADPNLPQHGEARPLPDDQGRHPFPSLLRQRRYELGLSQEELAARAGGVWRTGDIMALESGRIILPSWIRLLALAEALDLSAAVLLQAVCPTCADDPTKGALAD